MKDIRSRRRLIAVNAEEKCIFLKIYLPLLVIYSLVKDADVTLVVNIFVGRAIEIFPPENSSAVLESQRRESNY